jgi:hypothetical protein
LALGSVASATRSEIGNVPEACGTPEMSPVVGWSVTPAGSAPEASDQTYGAAPPLADGVAEYATPTVPRARVVVVSDSEGVGCWAAKFHLEAWTL